MAREKRLFLELLTLCLFLVLGWELLQYPVHGMWEARGKPRGLIVVSLKSRGF